MKHIAKFRKKKNMTREELAVATQIPFDTLKGYELGVRNPKTERALILAKVLGVTIEELG